MLELIATLILLVIVIQFMAIVDNHNKLKQVEKSIAEIINNELKVYKLKHNGIELKNIDLSNISMTEQWDKVAEEDIEFEESDDIFEMISEFWDTVQARLGILQKLGVDAKIVMKYYPEHLKKLENRPRTKEIE
ncbi:hypothetical protein [Clostridium cadaveris]|uniref:hypothetical protein n=1 Tax=Clostridium cadaveris TaxID=1529 RepID=UPI0025A41985|nr:hypothetical protein [Clostridium cadaveris]MDM8312760.1 hypothetical protein [Clostridium cadaveris]